jgi:replication fork protection complex subunit Csm3/Swi3
MQIMRKEWIDEGKPKRYTHDASEEPTAGAPVNNGNMDTDRNDIGNNTSSEPQEPGRHDSGVQEQPTGDERPSLFGNGNGNQRTEFDFDDDDLFVPDTINGEPKGSAPSDNPPEEDDLDALLGETDGIEPRGAPTRLPPPVEDDFDGDMEAMDMYGV